ncbi:MAG TPA: DoxX family protein [Chitinophagaceae bacterium]|nr:DoxX family protein [Chitinophagaceae bacterium]
MCKRKKNLMRTLPTLLVSAAICGGAVLKITGVHPMMPHFVDMGLLPHLKMLGGIEILCILLFLFPKTIKLGLLLLTGYFGGAMAAEMPYHMIAAPAVILVLIWVTAFIHMPELFVSEPSGSLTIAKS